MVWIDTLSRHQGEEEKPAGDSSSMMARFRAMVVWSGFRGLRDLPGAPLPGTLAKTDRPSGMALGVLQA